MSNSEIYTKICEIEDKWINRHSTSDDLFYDLLFALKDHFEVTKPKEGNMKVKYLVSITIPTANEELGEQGIFKALQNHFNIVDIDVEEVEKLLIPYDFTIKGRIEAGDEEEAKEILQGITDFNGLDWIDQIEMEES